MSLVIMGRKGLGTALHICSFVDLGWLEVHLEMGSNQLSLTCLKGETLWVRKQAMPTLGPDSSRLPPSTRFLESQY